MLRAVSLVKNLWVVPVQTCHSTAPQMIQPRSQGPFSTLRKYFLEVEKGPWERGWLNRCMTT